MTKDPLPEREVYSVKCPDCKAKPGFHCVYMPPKERHPYSLPDPKWGHPTQRPHNGRRQKYHDKINAEARRQWSTEQIERAKEAQWIFDARRANADALGRETAELKAWLRCYSSVLTSTPIQASVDPVAGGTRDTEET